MSQPSSNEIGRDALVAPDVRDDYAEAYYDLLREVGRDLVDYTGERPSISQVPEGYTYYNFETSSFERLEDGNWVVLSGLGEEGSPLPETIHAQGGQFGSLTVNGKDVDDFTDQLQSDVSENASDIENIESDFQSDISDLEDSVDSNASSISSLESDVSSNSGDISSLESNKADRNGDDISASSLDAGTLEARNTLIVPGSF